MFIATSGNVGIGTTTPTSPFHVASEQSTGLQVDNFYAAGSGAASQIIGRRALGTAAAPLAVTTGERLAMFGAAGATGSVFSSISGAMIFRAEEAFTGAKSGTSLRFETTPLASNVRQERMQITPAGDVYMGYNGGSVAVGATSASAGAILDINGSGALASSIIVPRDSSANRPATGVNGMIRYNLDNQALETFAAGTWASLSTTSGTGSQWTTSGANIYRAGAGNVGIGTATPTGTLEVMSTSANALVVGPNGVTNPALKINASTASAVTGLSVTSAAAGGGVTLSALSSANDEKLLLTSKGNAHLTLQSGSATSAVILAPNGGAQYSYYPGYITLFPSPNTNTASKFEVRAAADTNLAAGAETLGAHFNLAQTRTHVGGAVSLQRDVRISPSSHAFTAASTVTDAATFAIDGPPNPGAFGTFTNSHGLYIPTSVVAGVTNSYGLNVAATTGATN
ncbi:MAG: hypothetical protein EON56_04110, partial [Alphaproteobacteria bacterium]